MKRCSTPENNNRFAAIESLDLSFYCRRSSDKTTLVPPMCLSMLRAKTSLAREEDSLLLIYLVFCSFSFSFHLYSQQYFGCLLTMAYIERYIRLWITKQKLFLLFKVSHSKHIMLFAFT